MFTADLIHEIEARLPELEWKLTALKGKFSTKHLPHHLFPRTFENMPEEILASLRDDIQRLSVQQNKNSAAYLAGRLHQKITLLVTYLSEINSNSQPQANLTLIDKLTSRQALTLSLQQKLEALKLQQEALQARLNKTIALDIQLKIKKEIGEIERYMAEIQEKQCLYTVD